MALTIDERSSVDVKTLVADVIDTVYDSDDEDHWLTLRRVILTVMAYWISSIKKRIPITMKWWR